MIGQLALGTAAPVKRYGRRLDLDPAELAREVFVADLRVRGMENLVILVHQVRQRVTHRDVRRTHAHQADKLVEQGDDHLRRRVHIILTIDECIAGGVDVPLAPDHAHPVGLDDDLLAGLVADVTLAACVVEMAEEPVPGLADGAFASEIADGAGHHGVDAVLAGVAVLEPVAVARAAPVERSGIMYPDDAAGMDALGVADGLHRLGLAAVGSGGLERLRCGPQGGRRPQERASR